MITTVEALQELYVTLGGDAADVANINLIPDMISAISVLEEGKSEEERTVTTDEINAIINTID